MLALGPGVVVVAHSSDDQPQAVPVVDRVQGGTRGDVVVEEENRDEHSLDQPRALGDVGQRGMVGTLGDRGEDQMDPDKDHEDHMDQVAS